jgi:hypothetical protein
MVRLIAVAVLWVLVSVAAEAQTTIRLVPVDGATVAAGARFDIRVEATAPAGAEAPAGLTVTLDGADITARNIDLPARTHIVA